MPDPTIPAKKYGIAVIANDKISDWLLPFLESYLATNKATPLYLIPYDDNVSVTRKAADIYGVNFVTPDSAELDALAARLYPLFPGHRRRLRKFLSLALPLDEVLYVDVDTLLFRDFSELFGLIESKKTDFLMASSSEEYVYNKKQANYEFLRDARLFNDGFFLTSNHILSLRDFYETMKQDEKIFHTVRKRGMLFAQPMTNFVVHRRGLKVASLRECIETASDESFYKAENVSFTPDGPIDLVGNRIFFAHWAGATSLPARRVFDAVWRQYSEKASARMSK